MWQMLFRVGISKRAPEKRRVTLERLEPIEALQVCCLFVDGGAERSIRLLSASRLGLNFVGVFSCVDFAILLTKQDSSTLLNLRLLFFSDLLSLIVEYFTGLRIHTVYHSFYL